MKDKFLFITKYLLFFILPKLILTETYKHIQMHAYVRITTCRKNNVHVHLHAKYI